MTDDHLIVCASGRYAGKRKLGRYWVRIDRQRPWEIWLWLGQAWFNGSEIVTEDPETFQKVYAQ